MRFSPYLRWPYAVASQRCWAIAFRSGTAFAAVKARPPPLGVVCVIQPLAMLPMLATWLLVLGLSGWVGLATMSAGISLVAAMLWLQAPDAHLWFSVALALFLIFTHRGNIHNMIDRSEYRFEKAMIRNWFR